VQGPIDIMVHHVRRLEQAHMAVHHVTEVVRAETPEGLQTAFVMATNVYVRTEQGWRMVAHHASPGLPQDLPDIVEPRGVLH
jgi:hypothetical protein